MEFAVAELSMIADVLNSLTSSIWIALTSVELLPSVEVARMVMLKLAAVSRSIDP